MPVTFTEEDFATPVTFTEDDFKPVVFTESDFAPTDSAPTPIPRSSEELAALNFQRQAELQKTFPGYKGLGEEAFPANTPIFKIIPELTTEEQTALKEATPEEQRKAGYAQGAAQAINSLTTPENITLLAATAGFGGVPIMGRAVALAFAASMAAHVPEIAATLGEEFAKPKEQRDEQKIGQLIAEGGVTTGFTTMAGLHGAKPGKPGKISVETPAEAGQRGQLIDELNRPVPFTEQTAAAVADTKIKPETPPPIPETVVTAPIESRLKSAKDFTEDEWGLMVENLRDGADTFGTGGGARSSGKANYELQDLIDEFGAFARNRGESTVADSFKEFRDKSGASETKLRQLRSVLVTEGLIAQKASRTPPAEPPKVAEVVAPEPPLAEAPPAKQKLPVQDDMAVTADQLKIASENIDQLLTRGNWTDEIDVKLAKGRPADPRTKINVEIDEAIKGELVASAKRVETLRRKAGQQADPVTQNLLKLEEAKMKVWLGRFQESGRTWHDIGMSRQRMAREMAESSQTLREMIGSVKQQLPILDQIWKDLGERKFADAGKHFADYLRMNLFTLGSWTLDFGTNLGVVASHIPSWAALDVVHFATGQPAQRMLSALRSIKLSSKNLVPWNERFRLPEKIERDLGTTAGGEFEGRGKEIMVDFSEILKSKPELASKLKPLDAVISAPVRMKRAVDNFFGRFGATAELYNSAYTAGRKSRLNGDALKSFVDDFIKNPPDEAGAKAVKAGKEFKFNRDLTAWEERFANNLITKLVVETFPRWTFQFTRWAGEMIGANPAFFKDVVRGKANHEAVIDYLSKAATGWGAIYGFGQLFYDDIDANTMEYVDEHGDRTRLSGRTPAPELFLVNAILRGDRDKAKAAFAHVSLPGAKLLSGEPAGLISPLVDTMRESFRGRYTAERTAVELTKLVNDMFPGKSVLGFIRSFFDPTIREGIGSPIPGVSSALHQRINPTTGEPLAPKQRIPGTKIEFPTVGGTPFPGAVRVLNDIEKALTNHGMALTRPRRTSLIELPAEDVSKEVRREYEKLVGKNVKQILGEGIRNEDWKSAPFEIRREILSAWLETSRAIAKAQIADKYGASSVSVKSVPLNIKRLPENLKR